MIGGLILGLVGLTSVGACIIARKALGFSGRRLIPAMGKMVETAGTMLVFLAVNLAVAITTILVFRKLTGIFVSLYHASDVSLLVLSIMQGVAFQWWGELSGIRTSIFKEEGDRSEGNSVRRSL